MNPFSELSKNRVIYIVCPRYEDMSSSEIDYLEKLSRNGGDVSGIKIPGNHTLSPSLLEGLVSTVLGNDRSILIVFEGDRIGDGLDEDWFKINFPYLINNNRVIFLNMENDTPILDVDSNKRATGVDVSEFRADFPFEKALDQSFFITRATFGAYKVDNRLDYIYNRMSATNKYIGFYHYLHPRHSPEEQARIFIESIRGKRFDIPLIIDVEQNLGINLPLPSYNTLHRFIVELRKTYDKKIIIYTNLLYNNISRKETFDADLWAAHWGVESPTIADAWSNWTIWQSGVKNLDFYNRSVDFNEFNGTASHMSDYLRNI